MISLFRNFTHTFRRFWITSILNFCGLVVAFAAFFLFMTKIDEMLRYNRCFDDFQKIYRVELEGTLFGSDSSRIANVLAPISTIAKNVNHVEDATYIPASSTPIQFFRDDKFVTSIQCYGSNGKGLNFWRKGIAPDSLSKDYPVFVSKRDGMVIPRSFAKKWFGTTDVVGKDLKWEMDGVERCFKVVSVYEDFPKNCCVKNALYRYEISRDSLSYGNYNYHVYVKVDSAINIPQVENDILDTLIHRMRKAGIFESDEELKEAIEKRKMLRLSLAPLHQTYFSGVDNMTDKGDMNILSVLFISGIMVIIISNVNMMNFSLAQAPFRLKNINTRRVFGANRWTLRGELVLEGMLVCFAAFVIAMLLMYLINFITVGNINPLDHRRIVELTLAATLFVGFFSSTYPAYFSTSFPPAIAMKGLKDIPMRSRRLRNVRISFQVFISYVAIECVLMYVIQAFFLYNTDYGYDKEHILYGNLNSIESVARKDELAKELTKIEGVENVSYSRFAIGTTDRYMAWSRTRNDGDDIIVFTVMPVDKNYIKTMGIDILQGRDFEAKDSVGAFIANEAAMKAYPWLKLGSRPFHAEDKVNYPIIGVCRNVRFCSMRENDDESPLIFVYSEDKIAIEMYNSNMNLINIRMADNADRNTVQEQISKKYSEMFKNEPELYLGRLGETLSSLYHYELISFLHACVLAFIYLVITLIGVSSTITFENEYHRKEMGIRRVFGASVWNITFIKAHIYIILLTASFFLSIPLTEVVSAYLLKGFTRLSSWLWLAYPISYFIMMTLGLSLIFIQRYMFAKEKTVKSVNRD